MSKQHIKQLLREFLEVTTEASEKTEKKPKKDSKSKIEAEYAQINSGFEGLGAPNQADIMQLAGMGSVGNKTSESLFGKKLRREKNDEGGTYQFSPKERASVIKALATAKK
jgi:hypothetical protein